MTTIALVVGMSPVTLASDAGAAGKWFGLAIIGGLVSSIFQTLIVVPVVYQLVDRRMEKTVW